MKRKLERYVFVSAAALWVVVKAAQCTPADNQSVPARVIYDSHAVIGGRAIRVIEPEDAPAREPARVLRAQAAGEPGPRPGTRPM